MLLSLQFYFQWRAAAEDNRPELRGFGRLVGAGGVRGWRIERDQSRVVGLAFKASLVSEAKRLDRFDNRPSRSRSRAVRQLNTQYVSYIPRFEGARKLERKSLDIARLT